MQCDGSWQETSNTQILRGDRGQRTMWREFFFENQLCLFCNGNILEFFKCLGDRNEHENLQFHDSYMKSAVETLSADENLEDLRENSYNFDKVRDVKPLVSE